MKRDRTIRSRSLAGLVEIGRHADAVALAEELISETRLELGDHVETAVRLQDLAALLVRLGRYDAARPPLDECLRIRRRLLGERHPAVGTGLSEAAMLEAEARDFKRARSLIQEALAIWRERFPESHTLIVEGKERLERIDAMDRRPHEYLAEALRHYRSGLEMASELRFDDAEASLRTAAEINTAGLGADHAHVGHSLKALGSVLSQQRRYPEARGPLEEALRIARASGDNQLLSETLNELGLVENRSGRSAEAIPHLEEALIAARARWDRAAIAAILNNLGGALQNLGDTQGAEARVAEAVSVSRTLQGEEARRGLAASLSSLAGILGAAGRYRESIGFFKEAIAIKRELFGESHQEYATTLLNLATIYSNLGEAELAVEHASIALAILKEKLGDEHPLTWKAARLAASGVDDAGAPLASQRGGSPAQDAKRRLFAAIEEGNVGEVGRLAREVVDTVKEAFPPTSFPCVDTELRFGRICLLVAKHLAPEDRGDLLETAEALLMEACAVARTQGFDLLVQANGLTELAGVYLETGRPDPAFTSAHAAALAAAAATREVLSGLSQNARLGFYSQLAVLTSVLIHAYLANPTRTAADAAIVASVVLSWKNAVADASVREARILALADGFLGGASLKKLLALRVETARRIVRGPGKSARAFYADIERLASECTALEADLALHVGDTIFDAGEGLIDVSRLQGALDPSHAFLELVALTDQEGPAEPRVARYVAIVIAGVGPPSVVDLGAAEEIEPLLAALIEHISKEPTSGGEDVTVKMVGKKVWRRVGAKLFGLLAGQKRIYVSPDGAFSRVPFEVLQDEKGQPWFDTFEIEYVSSGRDLIGELRRTREPGPPVVVADPDFGWSGCVDGSPEDLPHEDASEDGLLDIRIEVGAPRGPGPSLHAEIAETRTEGELVSEILGARRLFRSEATKEALLALRSPRVLHIATHGFFFESAYQWDAINMQRLSGARLWSVLEDQAALQHSLVRQRDALSRLMGLLGHRMEEVGADVEPISEPVRAVLNNPMLASGLVLAGSNCWLRHEQTSPEVGTGYLTALEISTVDLSRTELVVLSSCESGLAEVKAQVGVFGLRRAFALAGARALIVSLWRVSDRETCVFMSFLYGELARGKPAGAALRGAQRAMRERSPHPFYWAPFVILTKNVN